MTKKKLLLLIGILAILQSCWCPDGSCFDESYQSNYEPVTLDREIFEKNVLLITPRASIQNSGKIYVKDNLLFINEKRQGFHVYDNSNPENPILINYINVPGATDMAIRNNIIYINQAIDLIAVEYDNTTKAFEVTKRIKNIFPEILSPDGFTAHDLPEGHVVIDWKLKK